MLLSTRQGRTMARSAIGGMVMQQWKRLQDVLIGGGAAQERPHRGEDDAPAAPAAVGGPGREARAPDDFALRPDVAPAPRAARRAAGTTIARSHVRAGCDVYGVDEWVGEVKEVRAARTGRRGAGRGDQAETRRAARPATGPATRGGAAAGRREDARRLAGRAPHRRRFGHSVVPQVDCDAGPGMARIRAR